MKVKPPRLEFITRTVNPLKSDLVAITSNPLIDPCYQNDITVARQSTIFS